MDKNIYKKKYEKKAEILRYSKMFSSQSEKMISELEIYVTKKIAAEMKNKESYLDVACGFGRITIPVSEVFKKSFGLDSSSKMIKLFKSKNIKLMKSDATEISFPDKKFDFITCFRFVMNFEKKDRIKILKEINRVLKDDGIFVCNLHINRYSVRGLMTCIRNIFTKQKQPNLSYLQIRNNLGESGFKIIKLYGIKILPYYNNYIIFDYKNLFGVEKKLSEYPTKFFADGYVIVCKKK
jgi:ubiquinone/menaquinone biosynthesis C-methylase UbiE